MTNKATLCEITSEHPRVFMRWGPGFQYPVIAHLNGPTRLIVLGPEDSDWLCVAFDAVEPPENVEVLTFGTVAYILNRVVTAAPILYEDTELEVSQPAPEQPVKPSDSSAGAESDEWKKALRATVSLIDGVEEQVKENRTRLEALEARYKEVNEKLSLAENWLKADTDISDQSD